MKNGTQPLTCHDRCYEGVFFHHFINEDVSVSSPSNFCWTMKEHLK